MRAFPTLEKNGEEMISEELAKLADVINHDTLDPENGDIPDVPVVELSGGDE